MSRLALGRFKHALGAAMMAMAFSAALWYGDGVGNIEEITSVFSLI